MKKVEKVDKKERKEKKKEIKKRLQSGEWSEPEKVVIPKIERFNWADEV